MNLERLGLRIMMAGSVNNQTEAEADGTNEVSRHTGHTA